MRGGKKLTRNNVMYKMVVLFTCFVLIVALFAGCSNKAVNTEQNDSANTEPKEEDGLKLKESFSGAMGTASAVGGWYVIGGGICTVVSKHVEGLTLTPQVTGGSVDNVRLLENKEVELIMVGAGTVDKAKAGKAPFTQKYENMNALYNFGATANHIVVKKDSPINSIYDLKGKKVAIGPPGSGTEAISRVLFKVAKIEDDVKALPMGFADMYDALKDGNIDAFLLQASPPGPALEELARTTEIKLLNFEDEFLDAVKEVDPSYYKGVIKAGTYTGVNEDINNPMSVSYIACRPDLPEDIAYAIVKATFENLAEIQAVHAGAKAIELEIAIEGINVPIHPGALKYYKEKGLVK